MLWRKEEEQKLRPCSCFRVQLPVSMSDMAIYQQPRIVAVALSNIMATPRRRPKKTLPAGRKVILKAVPPGLLDNLPVEDQRATSEIVGKPVMLNEYDADGRAELEIEIADKNVLHGNFSGYWKLFESRYQTAGTDQPQCPEMEPHHSNARKV